MVGLLDGSDGYVVLATDRVEGLAQFNQMIGVFVGDFGQGRGKIVHLRHDLLGRGLVHLRLADQQLLSGLEVGRIQTGVVLDQRTDGQRIAFGNRIGGLPCLHHMGDEGALLFAPRHFHLGQLRAGHPHRFARLQAAFAHGRVVLVELLLGNAVEPRERIDRLPRLNRVEVIVGVGDAHDLRGTDAGLLRCHRTGEAPRRQNRYQQSFHRCLFKKKWNPRPIFC